MNEEINKNKIPDEALRLLPWYATGWLSSEERAYVKENLAEYPEFQELLLSEYEVIRLVKDDNSLLDQSLLDAPEVRLERVLGKIKALETVEGIQNEKESSWVKLKSFFQNLLFGESTKFQYASIAVVSTLAIALLFAFISPLVKEGNSFYPATIETSLHDNRNVTVLLVGLNTEPNAPKLLSVLKASNAKISSIPGKDAMYQITLPVKLTPDQTNLLIKSLSKNKDLFWFAGEAY